MVKSSKVLRGVPPSDEVLPRWLADRVRREIQAYLARVEEHAVLREFAAADDESGWKDYIFEVRVDAAPEKLARIREDLGDYLDDLTEQLPESERDLRGDFGIWVREPSAIPLV